MREKVRFPKFGVIFQHRDGSLHQCNRKNLSATGTIKREKNFIFISNLGIFHIIAIYHIYPFYFLSYFSTYKYFYTELLIITVKKSKDLCDREDIFILFQTLKIYRGSFPLFYLDV